MTDISPVDIDWLNEYLLLLERSGKAETTINETGTFLRVMFRELPEWSECSTADIEEFLDNRGYEHSSRRQRVFILKGFFRFVYENEASPAERLVTPSTRYNKARVPVYRADIEHLLRETHGNEHLVVSLAALAGLRVSEIGKLKQSDVSLADGLLHVRDAKGGKSRWVALHPHLVDVLPVGNPERWVVWRDSGLPYTAKYLSDWGKKILRRHGVSGSMHMLRAWFATSVAESGSMKVAQEALGHSDIRVTQGYVRPDMDAHKRAVNALDVAIGGDDGGLLETRQESEGAGYGWF